MNIQIYVNNVVEEGYRENYEIQIHEKRRKLVEIELPDVTVHMTNVKELKSVAVKKRVRESRRRKKEINAQ